MNVLTTTKIARKDLPGHKDFYGIFDHNISDNEKGFNDTDTRRQCHETFFFIADDGDGK